MRFVMAGGLLILSAVAAATAAAQEDRLQSSEYFRLRSVGDVEFSPDGTKIACTIVNSDRPGRQYAQIWVMDAPTGQPHRLGAEQDVAANPTWSPDGHWIAFAGTVDGKDGLGIVHPDGSGATFLAALVGSNSPLPKQGATMAWSPDSRSIAFVSATPGPETAAAIGDPIVITRYLYKPTFTEGMTHFNDNRRLHLFLVDISTKQVRLLTDGIFDEHSIDWSPDGLELAFISNREANPEQFFNYDLFVLKIADGSIHRLTAT